MAALGDAGNLERSLALCGEPAPTIEERFGRWSSDDSETSFVSLRRVLRPCHHAVDGRRAEISLTGDGGSLVLSSTKTRCWTDRCSGLFDRTWFGGR